MFNTMFDTAFSIDHECQDPNDVPVDKLLDQLSARLAYLRENPSEAAEAFGVCDTYEHPTTN